MRRDDMRIDKIRLLMIQHLITVMREDTILAFLCRPINDRYKKKYLKSIVGK